MNKKGHLAAISKFLDLTLDKETMLSKEYYVGSMIAEVIQAYLNERDATVDASASDEFERWLNTPQDTLPISDKGFAYMALNNKHFGE